MSTDKKIVEALLANAGVTLNGSQPWDPQVHNDQFYRRVLAQGSLGLGESYMDGWWDCAQLDEFFHKILLIDIDRTVRGNWWLGARLAMQYLGNMGRRTKAFVIGQRHYDKGNDLYAAMLDQRLTYTCGYWPKAQDLDSAQEAKLDLVCRKIGLRAKQTVLDIGSGWASFMGYAAEKYDAICTGVTVSKEQKVLADERYSRLSVKTLLQDYRDIAGQFDQVVSLGMFEHVGYKNYRTFMEVAHRALKDGGLFLLHTIGGNRSVKGFDPWIGKYIFPNSMLPSIQEISRAVEGLFVVEDWHNFGADYDTTLMAWFKNFDAAWSHLKGKYSQRFYRMWSYYLLSCAGSFRARKNQLWQVVLSKRGVAGGYKSVR
ncbi:cyclopropane fatty acyl phospholipid synthase [Candidatus Falkowbacteria bacterium]|nr:cyclopropane fatty acyl phospholipid synthase [Candidatus Falkowbacteria bacterium]